MNNDPSMYVDDAASQALGITIEVERPGHATATMTVRPDMVNGLGVCHGGLLFTLADTAMAFASNAHGEATFAVHAEIDWLLPTREGQVVVAVASEIAKPGRTAVHDVEITADGELVAIFRGRTRSVGRKVNPDAVKPNP